MFTGALHKSISIHLTKILTFNCTTYFPLKGGPGATSLFGLFKENGPIRSYAKDKPVSGFEEELDQQKLNEQGFKFPMYNRKMPYAELNRYSWNR